MVRKLTEEDKHAQRLINLYVNIPDRENRWSASAGLDSILDIPYVEYYDPFTGFRREVDLVNEEN